MAQLIKTADLFSSGTSNFFNELGSDTRLKESAAEIIGLAGVIKSAHIVGSPNNSLYSTEGAIESTNAILDGLSGYEEEERFFGTNIREAIKEFKSFIAK